MNTNAGDFPYAEMLNRITEGCQIIDYEWRYVFLNNAATEHSMQKKETLLGFKIFDRYPGIEKTELFVALRDCMKNRNPHTFVNEFTYPDGQKRWFKLTIQPDPRGIFITSIDITDLKLSELNREKLIADLQTAIDEINTLKGLIPICSNCKRIRDDHGYWQQLECYIQEHTSATFSHSICPECAKKLYPDLYEES